MMGSPALGKARVVVLGAFLFTAIGAAVFRTPPILFLAAVLCGAPLISSLMGKLGQRSLQVERSIPDCAMAHDSVRARVTFHNRSSLPLFLVHCRPGALTLWGTAAPRKPAAAEPEQVIAVLAAGESVAREWEWRMARRGEYLLEPACAGTIDPLGLNNRLSPRTPPHPLLVLPRPLKLARLGWTGGSSGGAVAPVHATRVADATDFHGVRAHQPGEGLRRIHWKSTARTGVLHVIDWEEEVASDVTLLLDAEASVASGHVVDAATAALSDHDSDTFEAAISAAASMASYLLERGYEFRLLCWEPGTRGQLRLGSYSARHRGALRGLLEVLAKLQLVSGPKAGLLDLAREVQSELSARQSVVVVTTDLAQVSASLNLLGRNRSVAPRALVFGSESFAGPLPRSGRPPAAELPGAARLFRYGESLTSILERGA